MLKLPLKAEIRIDINNEKIQCIVDADNIIIIGDKLADIKYLQEIVNKVNSI